LGNKERKEGTLRKERTGGGKSGCQRVLAWKSTIVTKGGKNPNTYPKRNADVRGAEAAKATKKLR